MGFIEEEIRSNARVKGSILQASRKDFETLEMKVGEIITNYFARVLSVVSKMRVYGEQMKDITIVEKAKIPKCLKLEWRGTSSKGRY